MKRLNKQRIEEERKARLATWELKQLERIKKAKSAQEKLRSVKAGTYKPAKKRRPVRRKRKRKQQTVYLIAKPKNARISSLSKVESSPSIYHGIQSYSLFR